MQRLGLVLTCAAALAVSACGGHATKKGPKHPFEATFTPVLQDGITGVVQVAAVPGGVHLQGRLTGLAPASTHGFHLRQYGDCSAPDASSTGGHFNPTSTSHGDPSSLTHHAGDIVNQVADDQGAISVDATVRGVSLESGVSDDVIGHALVVDRDADDYTTQPDGNSGPGIGCAVILKKKK